MGKGRVSVGSRAELPPPYTGKLKLGMIFPGISVLLLGNDNISYFTPKKFLIHVLHCICSPYRKLTLGSPKLYPPFQYKFC